MSQRYTVRFEITAALMNDAFRLHQSTLIAGYRIVTAIVAGTGILLAVAGNRLGVPLALFGIAMLAMTWMGFVDRWLYGRGSRGLVGTVCEYDFDDQGIHYTHALGSGLLPWASLTEIRANDRVIVFRRDRYMAASAPTRAFSSAAERREFLVFARARVTEGSDAT